MKRGSISVAVLGLIASACTSALPSPASPSLPVAELDLVNVYWVLESIDVRGEGAFESADGLGPTLQFLREGRASAGDGCNTSSGTYEIEDEQLTISSDGFWTLAGCFPTEEQAIVRRAFHDSWTGINEVHYGGETLTLLADDATMELRRRRLKEWPLDGTRWRASSGDFGTAELIFDLDGSVLTVEGECLRSTVKLAGDAESGWTGAESTTADVCREAEATEEDRARHDDLVFQLKGRTTVETVAGLPLLRVANGDSLDLGRARITLFRDNRPILRAPSDSVFEFRYLRDGEVDFVEVVRSGAYVVSQAPWHWSDGQVSTEAVVTIGELAASTSLRALSRAVQSDGDGGCGRNAEVQSLRFAKSDTHSFDCALDADPADPLLARTMELVREIVAGL